MIIKSRAIRWVPNGNLRAAINLVGPVAFAGSNFVVALMLQQYDTAANFGLYAFIQVVIASGMALSSGLFGTPLMISIARGADIDATARSFFKANIFYSLVAASVVFIIVTSAGGRLWDGCIAVVLATAVWFRWFGRSFAVAVQARRRVVIADLVYCIFAMGGLIFLVAFGLTLRSALILQVGCTIVSSITFLKLFTRHLSSLLNQPLSLYLLSFQKHGRWASLAVIATETTANIHAYIITLFLGPSSFAPIALATLLFRPVGVVLTGLVQFERPRMAVEFINGTGAGLKMQVSTVRLLVFLAWLVNCAAVSGVLFVLPSLIVRESYPQEDVFSALTFIALIVLFRGFREPIVAALQSGGYLRYLAVISIVCAPITVLVTLFVVKVAPGYVSLALAGPLLGELVLLLFTGRRYYAELNKLFCGHRVEPDCGKT